MAKGPELKTARLRLTPYAREDGPALHALCRRPEVRRYLFDNQGPSRGLIDELITRSEASFAQVGLGQWTLRPRDDGDDALLGFAGYLDGFGPPGLQLVYGLAPEAWGRGYVTEAVARLVRLGFERARLDEVVAYADLPNAASIRVMQRVGLGFDREITWRGLSLVRYRLARADWAAQAGA